MIDLPRFRQAQEGVYNQALKEVSAGRKRTHWMWFIFPQLTGLGHSTTAQYYGINDLDDATTYLADPLLGGRLIEITKALLTQPNHQIDNVFDYPDNHKVRSCMTLFAHVPNADPCFQQVINEFFNGESDPLTLNLIK